MLYAIRRISDNKYYWGKIQEYNTWFGWEALLAHEPRIWTNLSAVKGALTKIRNGALNEGESMTREEALDITICELEFRHVGDISYE